LFKINYLLQQLQEFATLALADYGYRVTETLLVALTMKDYSLTK
jgi:hypothetical protein